MMLHFERLQNSASKPAYAFQRISLENWMYLLVTECKHEALQELVKSLRKLCRTVWFVALKILRAIHDRRCTHVRSDVKSEQVAVRTIPVDSMVWMRIDQGSSPRQHGWVSKLI